MTRRNGPVQRAAMGIAVVCIVGASCASDTEPAADVSTESGEPDSSTIDLASVCPDPVVVQTDWYPSPEQGYLYQLIGAGGDVDTENGRYSGTLAGTNIDLEIRSGGPYLGYQPTSSLMYQDPDILLGFQITDAQVRNSGDLPTVAVMAPFHRNPQILMWDPEQYDFASFDEIGRSDATVLVYGVATYVEYLIGIGAIRREQVDGGYDGSPARFVADGSIVQQGFATSEPYQYLHDFEEFGRDVGYLVIDESGFNVYSQVLAGRPETIEAEADCLSELIPLVQQSVVDFYADPAPTSALLVDIVEQLNTSWIIDEGLMEYSAATVIDQAFVANDTDGSLGSMDAARMTRMVDLLIPLLEDVGSVRDGLVAEDIYTNEFIDTSITLPS